jgi:hypothetical protein
MPNTTTTDLTHAVDALKAVQLDLLDARMNAVIAVSKLPAGARQHRADQLAELIADAVAHCQRLHFICEADARYAEQADQ